MLALQMLIKHLNVIKQFVEYKTVSYLLQIGNIFIDSYSWVPGAARFQNLLHKRSTYEVTDLDI